MNPLDWRGPEFLAFYALVAAGTLLLMLWFRRQRELARPAGVANLSDPYEIAYLRGGKNESIRVATISLIDRGLLQVVGETRLAAAGPESAKLATDPLEKAVVERLDSPLEATELFQSARLEGATERYRRKLSSLGLLPDEALQNERSILFIGGVALLGGLALAKVAVALSRGRTNVLFLILVAVAAAILLYKVCHPRVTEHGRAVLQDLRQLFDRLQHGVRVGAGGAELALLAAVFGLAAVPETVSPWATTLFTRAAGTGGSACGSSCGSSCGGGGCGGGCGGCGS